MTGIIYAIRIVIMIMSNYRDLRLHNILYLNIL